MSRLAILIAVIYSLCSSACIADENDKVATSMSMAEAINERDPDPLHQLIAEDMVRHSAATAGASITSRDDFKAFLRADFAAVPDSVISAHVIFGNEEFVAMRATCSGTQTGLMGPFPASGKIIDLPFIGILRFDDGAIAEMCVKWDNVHMLTRLGHLQMDAEPPE